MRKISKIQFTSKGEVSNYFNLLKKFEISTDKPTKNHFSGLTFKYNFLLPNYQ